MEGWKRLVIVSSCAWLIGYYLFDKERVDLWLSWMIATPSTKCVDVVGQVMCVLANADSFNQWWSGHGPPFSVLGWWLCVPLAMFASLRIIPWIIAGFKG